MTRLALLAVCWRVFLRCQLSRHYHLTLALGMGLGLCRLAAPCCVGVTKVTWALGSARAGLAAFVLLAFGLACALTLLLVVLGLLCVVDFLLLVV